MLILQGPPSRTKSFFLITQGHLHAQNSDAREMLPSEMVVGVVSLGGDARRCLVNI